VRGEEGEGRGEKGRGQWGREGVRPLPYRKKKEKSAPMDSRVSYLFRDGIVVANGGGNLVDGSDSVDSDGRRRLGQRRRRSRHYLVLESLDVDGLSDAGDRGVDEHAVHVQLGDHLAHAELPRRQRTTTASHPYKPPILQKLQSLRPV